MNCDYSPSGPVYVNANAVPSQPQAQAPAAAIIVQPTQQANFVTQTVYGFLDFTTTIGNTVMIFSPQSAAPGKRSISQPTFIFNHTLILPLIPFLEPPKQTVVVTTVIETKPPPPSPSTSAPSIVKAEIKPSKTIIKSTEKPIQVISSVVKVVAAESHPAPPTQIINSIVNVVQPQPQQPIISSHVEVISDNTKSPNIPKKEKNLSKIEVQNPVILSSHVNVNIGPSSVVNVVEDKPIVYSSIVEVQTSHNEKDGSDDDNGDDDNQHDDEEEDEHEESNDGDDEHHHQQQQEDDEPVIQIGNNIGEPEYDFLSRQPAEYVEETYRVVNLRPSNAKFLNKPRQTTAPKRAPKKNADDTHPTGLVTKLGGTVVKDGVTTVHETSVIGTYISGKYAQVLQSTSQLYHGNAKPKPTPSSSLRILKTAAPTIPKHNRHALEPTPVSSSEETAGLPLDAIYGGNSQSPNLVRSSRRPANPSGSFKNRFRNRNKDDIDDIPTAEEAPAPAPVHSQNNHHNNNNKKSPRNRNNKPKK